MSKHTDLPWVYDYESPCMVYSDDATKDPVARLHGKGFELVGRDNQEADANARHIVHCVNNYDRLREALRTLTDEAVYCEHDIEDSEDLRERIGEARALLQELDKLEKDNG